LNTKQRTQKRINERNHEITLGMSCPDDEAIPAVGAPVFSIKCVYSARVQKIK
jgi:hypothetical protein